MQWMDWGWYECAISCSKNTSHIIFEFIIHFFLCHITAVKLCPPKWNSYVWETVIIGNHSLTQSGPVLCFIMSVKAINFLPSDIYQTSGSPLSRWLWSSVRCVRSFAKMSSVETSHSVTHFFSPKAVLYIAVILLNRIQLNPGINCAVHCRHNLSWVPDYM